MKTTDWLLPWKAKRCIAQLTLERDAAIRGRDFVSNTLEALRTTLDQQDQVAVAKIDSLAVENASLKQRLSSARAEASEANIEVARLRQKSKPQPKPDEKGQLAAQAIARWVATVHGIEKLGKVTGTRNILR